MKLFITIISVLLFLSCNKDDYADNLAGRELITSFSYVNPQGKSFEDSIINLPEYGFIINNNSGHEGFAGGFFKSNSKRINKSGKGFPTLQNVFIQWKLSNLAGGSILKTEISNEITLPLYQAGQYLLTHYVYENKADREQSIRPVDSMSKIITVENLLQVDSISVDHFSGYSPYLNLGLKENEPVELYVSVYERQSDLKNGKEPMFKSELVKNVKQGDKDIKIGIPQKKTVPFFPYQQIGDKDQVLIQLNAVQGNKSYTLIDNAYGLIFNDMNSGYYSKDKSSLLDVQRLRFGTMTLTMHSSYTFMQ